MIPKVLLTRPSLYFHRKLLSTQSFSSDYVKKPKYIGKFIVGTSLLAYGYYQYSHFERNRELAQKLDIPLYKILLYKSVPFSALSPVAHCVSRWKIDSLSLRRALFGTYAKLYGCDMSESSKPLDAYGSFGEFFSRSLRSDARTIKRTRDGLVAGSDGTILHLGSLAADNKEVFPEQVKGSFYSLKELVGEEAASKFGRDPKKSIYYCTIYLSPGDYHRFHSPANFAVDSIQRFSGEVLSVAPWVLRLVPKLFCMNERVAVNGQWNFGRFSYVPVGAANVGTIVINSKVKEKSVVAAGSEIGHFELGSSLLFIFEAPKNGEWSKKPGDKIKLGEPLFKVAASDSSWW